MKHKLDELLKKNLKFPESSNIQQRGIADKIEVMCNDIIKTHFQDVKAARSRRSIEDISIGNTYVDHKTSDESLNFKMPNLISIDRLMKLDRPLVYNFVLYNSETKSIVDNFSLDVYELNWKHLKIQNLGVGQLQISNMKNFLESPKTTMTKEEWLNTLRTESVEFYERLITKTQRRMKNWQTFNVASGKLDTLTK